MFGVICLDAVAISFGGAREDQPLLRARLECSILGRAERQLASMLTTSSQGLDACDVWMLTLPCMSVEVYTTPLHVVTSSNICRIVIAITGVKSLQ